MIGDTQGLLTLCRQTFNRKAEKRPHSRSPSEDSGRERRRSASPKRRRRDSPPASARGVYKRRSPSRDSRYSDDRRDDRGSGKQMKGEGASHREQQRDKQYSGKRDRYTDDEEPTRYQHKGHPKQKRRDSTRRHRSRSLSKSRSRSPRSRSRSPSRSSSLSRGRRRGDIAPARRRSPTLSRSRSPPSPTKPKAHPVKHVSLQNSPG